MKRSWRGLICVSLAASVSSVLVTEIARSQPSASAVSSPAASSPIFSLLQVLFALVVVLGVIGLFAWVLRRMSQGTRLGGGLLKIRGGVMLGPKERVVLLEIADTWIVVGVGGGQVNALHAMPRPANAESSTAESHDTTKFATWLQQALRTKFTRES